jgi:hypothetical protein
MNGISLESNFEHHPYERKIFIDILLSQVSRRRRAVVCIGDAICDIPSVWVYTCTNPIWKFD